VNKNLGNDNEDIAARARHLLRACPKASLGTFAGDGDDGSGSRGPHVSLVLSATNDTGAPILLLSKLAVHTQNLLRNEKAGLLLDGTEGLDDPLTGGRLSLTGRVVEDGAEGLRRRYLARHESAALYADFADFAFYRFEIDSGHYVGGFGAIHDLSADELLVDKADADLLAPFEGEIIQHMNADHEDVLALIATRLNGAENGAWRLTGLDIEGCDLKSGARTERQDFHKPVLTPDDTRRAFINLAELARNGA